jgi:N-methylhydantoinase A
VIVVAVDIGGTFTDLMGVDALSGAVFNGKSLTTPQNLAQGVLDCIAKSGIAPGNVERLIHGSTIAINTLIERKGARTALVVTRGTRDVYAIGRGNRPMAFSLQGPYRNPLVARADIYEIDQRTLASGETLRPVNEAEVTALAHQLKSRGYEAVAICFLHSYADVAPEREVGRLIKAAANGAFVSASHEIMREYREYERISTTVVNAYVGPKVSHYVGALDGALRERGFAGELSIMQSNGGVMSPDTAARRPVTMMESGPVGGIIAAAKIGQRLGFGDIISFDMGGTTAKASLVRNGEPAMSEGYYVGGYVAGEPVMTPVVDVVEVGAGGGSIAWLDETGALKVGPRSAGAEPGPICYGRGGAQPTITDANVVLGRIGPEDFLGGEMKLQADAASRGIDKLGEPLGLSTPEAALAIVDIAVAKMALAVREVSVEQGYDPRDFALVASGGGGPLHAVAVARDLGIPKVIVPRFPAHFSALGMLMADERHDLVRTYLARIAEVDFAELARIVAELRAQAASVCRSKAPEFLVQFDIRYVGQEFSIPVPVTQAQIDTADRAGIRAAFDAIHERRYAHHAPEEPIEVINVRLIARAVSKPPQMPSPESRTGIATTRRVYFDAREPTQCTVYHRDCLRAGEEVRGPALIQEYGSTTVVYAGDVCEAVAGGELIVTLGGAT